MEDEQVLREEIDDLQKEIEAQVARLNDLLQRMELKKQLLQELKAREWSRQQGA